MQLAYGSYRHDVSENEVIRSVSRTLNARQQTLAVVRRWQISGKLQASDETSVTAAKLAMEIGYSRPFQDLVLYQSDLATIHDSLLNRGSTTGVRVIAGPDFPTGRGAEGVTFLSYQIVVEANYEFSRDKVPESGDPNRLESWTETITEAGGGARYAVVEVVEGPPVRQLLNQQTKKRVTQSGSAVGRLTWPQFPGPAYPNFENPAERQLSQATPQMMGQINTGFAISWTYVMEGPGLGGTPPNLWPS